MHTETLTIQIVATMISPIYLYNAILPCNCPITVPGGGPTNVFKINALAFKVNGIYIAIN